MKYFDIVTEQDEVIGKRTAVECHANPDLVHRVVHFTLVDRQNKKILISQRSFEVKFDSGKWCFMGEHVLSGETYEDAVQKGVKDELGVNCRNFSEAAHKIFSYATQTEFVRFFLVDWNGETISPSSAEIVDIKWLSQDELLAGKDTYSEMTQHWVEVINWKTFLYDSSKPEDAARQLAKKLDLEL